MEIIFAVVGVAVGAVIAFVAVSALNSSKQKQTAQEAQSLIESARKQADTLRREAEVEAKDKALEMRQTIEAERSERLKDVRSQEDRLNQREKSLDHRSDSLDAREHQISSMQGQVDKRSRDLRESEKQLERRRAEVEEEHLEINRQLEKVAGMTSDEAKTELLDNLKDEVAHESAAIIREAETRAKAESDKKSREILSIAIQRVAADHTSEITVSSIHIPSDDMKGRIIGREGRNIRAIETLTGVDLIIDDTPEAVILSGFDPVRREIARIALEKLIVDGRIHPARIEEMVQKATKEVNTIIKEEGERACFETGVHNLHPELVKLLGRLKYRTSYGQNVLQHSIEVATLAGMMAEELGLDPKLAKRGGLLHDIGKSIDHEVEGTHVEIGVNICKKYKESWKVINAVESHHGDVEATTLESMLVGAADALSAARPGARRETLETYIKRLENLENIANTTKGVEKSYAIQAGREIRVAVKPNQVKDDEVPMLAREIAKKIEAELEYPGQIKVNVVRETRATDYAK